MEKVEVKWISVEERLPPMDEEVLVLGYYANNTKYLAPIFVNKRNENTKVTDGNGFYRLSDHANVIITHWWYIPKI